MDLETARVPVILLPLKFTGIERFFWAVKVSV
jgi:hypothetical protein